MPAAPLPDDELWRLAALWDLDIDARPDTVMDAIVRAASLVCRAPIALVSVVDDTRQWFKSKVGLDANETAREIAFCAHAILGDGILEVPNATLDSRFSDNPLVTGDPNIRFYAGAPLALTDGTKIGTLCTIDQQPKQLDDYQRSILTELAVAASRLLEQNRAVRSRQDVSRRLRQMADTLEYNLT